MPPCGLVGDNTLHWGKTSGNSSSCPSSEPTYTHEGFLVSEIIIMASITRMLLISLLQLPLLGGIWLLATACMCIVWFVWCTTYFINPQNTRFKSLAALPLRPSPVMSMVCHSQRNKWIHKEVELTLGSGQVSVSVIISGWVLL